jgi:PAS domain S-box-containing protein
MTREEMRQLLEQIPIAACLAREGRFLAVNKRLAELVGFDLDALTGEEDLICAFIAPEDQARLMARREARQRGEPVSEEVDLVARSPSGVKTPIRARISPFPLVAPDALLLIATDERPRERVADMIRGLVDVAVAAQAEHTHASFFRVVREGLERLGLPSTVMEVAGGRFRFAPFLGPTTELGSQIRDRVTGWAPLELLQLDLGADVTLIGDLPGMLSSLSGLPPDRFRGQLANRGVLAVIRVGGEPRWVVACSAEYLDRAVAGAFALLARQLGAALESIRRIEELDTRNAELAILNDVAVRLAGSLELRPLLELGGETLRRLLDGDEWFMLLPDAGGEGLRFFAVQPKNADMAGKVLRFDKPSMAVSAFGQRRVMQYLDPLSEPDTSKELAERIGNPPSLAAPLIARGECLGVAFVIDRKRTRNYTQVEMDRAMAVAGQLALALLSARLYEDLRASYGKLERTQNELIDRERMAALGELSASIAHEVRNPLGVIFNSVGTLRRLLKPEGDISLLLEIIGEEADRLNRMVADLLDYSRPVRPALQPLPLEPLIEEALVSARQQIGPAAEAVRSRVQVASDAATVRADARLLRQALLNLSLNALQAMPRGGQLEIRAGRRDQEGAPFAEISIRDTGPGIPADARAKIFQPFFTTKPTGTGLGLAVVQRIVEGHGGSIELASATTGTEFHVLLPLEA